MYAVCVCVSGDWARACPRHAATRRMGAKIVYQRHADENKQQSNARSNRMTCRRAHRTRRSVFVCATRRCSRYHIARAILKIDNETSTKKELRIITVRSRALGYFRDERIVHFGRLAEYDYEL